MGKTKENYHVVFVYGTLLSGMSNHDYIETGSFFGEAVTADRYQMTVDGIPYVSRRDPICQIKGELYIVDDQTLAGLDRLEGHPGFYRREKIEIEFAGGALIEAWCYLCERSAGHSIVADGDYRRVGNALGMGV